jgi:glycogen(starch) synthase
VKILISSHAFAPSIGGIETVTRLLAEEFVRLQHDVVVLTQTAARDGETFPFQVVRQPSTRKLFGLIKWCDVFWQNNLSLRTIWPATFLRKPVVITHQGSYCNRPSGVDLALRVKRAVATRATAVSISNAVAKCFSTPSVVIRNPYDARLFTVRSTSTVRAGLVFVGRLVSEKGIDLLLQALHRLSLRGLPPQLTIIGSGSEQAAAEQLTNTLALENQVTFVGSKSPAEIVDLLNQHAILVVPSRYAEPFGIVALEGIACGCAVVGSSGGGLPEAIGPCGVTFANGDVEALSNALEKLLGDASAVRELSAKAPQHLARFHPTAIANSYLDLFRSKVS